MQRRSFLARFGAAAVVAPLALAAASITTPPAEAAPMPATDCSETSEQAMAKILTDQYLASDAGQAEMARRAAEYMGRVEVNRNRLLRLQVLRLQEGVMTWEQFYEAGMMSSLGGPILASYDDEPAPMLCSRCGLPINGGGAVVNTDDDSLSHAACAGRPSPTEGIPDGWSLRAASHAAQVI